MLFKKQTEKWYSFLPFYRKENIWQRYEPLWFVLIAISVVTILAIGLRTAITHQAKTKEKLYISPSSYSFEATDFFMKKTGFDELDVFGVAPAQAQGETKPKQQKTKIIIIQNKNDIAQCPNL